MGVAEDDHRRRRAKTALGQTRALVSTVIAQGHSHGEHSVRAAFIHSQRRVRP